MVLIIAYNLQTKVGNEEIRKTDKDCFVTGVVFYNFNYHANN